MSERWVAKRSNGAREGDVWECQVLAKLYYWEVIFEV